MDQLEIAAIDVSKGDSEPLLRIDRLSACIDTDHGWIWPIRDVSFDVQPGETLAVLGESGCGKTTILNAVLGTLEAFPGVVSGAVHIRGRDISPISAQSVIQNGMLRKSVHSEYSRHRRLLQGILGRYIGTVFQNHWQTLVPDRTISEQLHEMLSIHRPEWSLEARQDRIHFLFEKLALPEIDILGAKPQRLSTGECQRVSLAVAAAPSPALLLCDEPTTGVDWEVRRLIHSFLSELVDVDGCSVLIVTHDTEEVYKVADRFIVLTGGHCVESGRVSGLSESRANCVHPATRHLLNWAPDQSPVRNQWDETTTLTGCPYVAKCSIILDRGMDFSRRCRGEMPPRFDTDEAHWARCWDFEGETQ